MNYYLTVLKRYAVFSGRAQRAEYWYFTLFNAIIILVLNAISVLIFGNPMILFIVYILATFLPSLAVAVRRLHDAGRSGWMVLIGLIPFIGSIWLFVLLVIDSKSGENKYGPNPKEIVTA